ncbi:MAG: hypothetical protein ACR2NX_01005 [Chthoniobacterales bacterium]
MERAVAYWLLPAEPARGLLGRKIARLAEQFEAVAFEPHATVFVSRAGTRAPQEVLREMTPFEITLSVIGLAQSERFTQTLFVCLQGSDELQNFADTIARTCGEPPQPISDPHVSLLYAALDERTRRHLADATMLSLGQIVFDSICAIEVELPVQTVEDVRRWRRVA